MIDDIYAQIWAGQEEYGDDWFIEKMNETNKLFEQKTGYERVDNQEVLTDGGLIRPEDRVGV